MSERDTIDPANDPVTVHSLVADLRTLGLGPGMTVLVHSSLSRIGWVSGGPVAVVLALMRVIVPEGTLVMPTHSNDLSDPAEWVNPPVPEAWWQTIRDTMPAYDPDLTPTRGMGAIPETFRRQRDVTRSAHPAMSFAAWGAHAEQVTADHALENGLGERSPLARIYDLDGWVLLLGVGHGSNTSLHLAEYRADWPAKQTVMLGAPILHEGERQWVTYADINIDAGDFETIGAAFEVEYRPPRGRVGAAEAVLMRQRPLVDFAVAWMAAHRR